VTSVTDALTISTTSATPAVRNATALPQAATSTSPSVNRPQGFAPARKMLKEKNAEGLIFKMSLKFLLNAFFLNQLKWIRSDTSL
jgi:hypothetical protein